MSERIYGSGASQLVQLMRQYGYNKDIDVELATVTSAPPNLRIKIDNMSVDLDKDDVIVAQYLTGHARKVSINGGAESTLQYNDELKVNDRIIVASINKGQSYVILDRAVIY
jgi:hypothetical protein